MTVELIILSKWQRATLKRGQERSKFDDLFLMND